MHFSLKQTLGNHGSHLTRTKLDTCREAVHSLMAKKVTRATQKIVILWHVVAESSTSCSSCSYWKIQEVLDMPL